MIVLLYVFAGGIAICLLLVNFVARVVPHEAAFGVCGLLFLAAHMINSVVGMRQRSNRKLTLRTLAMKNGWSFNAAKTWPPYHEYGHLETFRRGKSRTLRHKMGTHINVHTHRLPVEMGDFEFTSKRSRLEIRYRLSYLVVRLPQPMPAVLLRPENIADRVMSAAGFNDIDFESKAFSDRYMVGCTDKKFAFRLISPLVMQFLMEKPAVPGLPSFSISNGWLGISGIDQYWYTDQFESALEWTRRFIELWPNEFLEPQAAESP